MIPDKELIAMCDCPEIQDRWEPRVGDKIAIFHKYPCIILALSKENEMDWTAYDEEKARNKHINKFDEPIYIPRIEDVLEWLVEYPIAISTPAKWGDRRECAVKCHHEGTGYIWKVPTLLQGLIEAYMHLEHNKTWNGKEWE